MPIMLIQSGKLFSISFNLLWLYSQSWHANCFIQGTGDIRRLLMTNTLKLHGDY
jgi:hypothetical protein